MKLVFLFCLIVTISVSARPQLQTDRERIESGKEFGLQLIYPLQELPQNRNNLQIETANGFTLLGIDSVDKVMRQNDFDDMFDAFFNGRSSRGYKARVYTFKLRAPKATGKKNAGQIFLTIDNQKTNLTGDLILNIQRAFTDDALSVTLIPSKKNIYEGEQFYVTLGLHTYEHFEGGLSATDMNTGDDFIVHRSDLSSLKFEPVPNTRGELQASVKFAWLSPTKSGTLQIPPFKFKYTKRGEPKVVNEQKKMGAMTMSFQSVKQESVDAEAVSPTLNINVKPLPTEGRPQNFSGMVGNYSFSADLDRNSLKVGDAMTLSISIKGDGLPCSIADPKLPDLNDFRTVPPENDISKKITNNKVITTKNIRIFIYPKKKGQFTIPEISYSWFNPTKKKYEIAKAGPWNINVEKGEQIAEATFNAHQTNGATQKQNIETLGNDIYFIHKINIASTNTFLYKKATFWIMLFLAIPFYIIAIVTIKKVRKRNSNVALLRKGQANKMLKSKFTNARAALQKGDTKALYAALENGLIDYISDITNLEFKGMTRTQMRTKLELLNVKTETIDAIDNWLEKCAFARFAPVNLNSNEQQQMLCDVESLCENISSLKRTHKGA